jgi:hypothetical protein
MESELNDNMMRLMAERTGTGYRDAYDRAQQSFTSDQARDLQAQLGRESSRQAEGQQAMTAAQLAAQYGLSADQAREASRQFGSGQAMTAAQLAAQYGLSADQANEASRQFAQDQAMRNAQTGAQYGLAGLQMGQVDRQFGATQGLASLAQQLAGAQAQGSLSRNQLQSQMDILNNMGIMGGIQRGIESEGLGADKAAFDEEWQFPYKQVQFMQSLLDGMPLAAQNTTYQQPGALSEFGGTLGGIMSIFKDLQGSAASNPPPTDNNGT